MLAQDAGAHVVRSIVTHAAVEKFCIVGRRLGFRLARGRIPICPARASTDRSTAAHPRVAFGLD